MYQECLDEKEVLFKLHTIMYIRIFNKGHQIQIKKGISSKLQKRVQGAAINNLQHKIAVVPVLIHFSFVLIHFRPSFIHFSHSNVILRHLLYKNKIKQQRLVIV